MTNTSVKIYKLSGKSLEAAKELNNELVTRNAGQLKSAWFRAKAEPLMQAVGLRSECVQVRLQDGALPRAYLMRPSCFIAPQAEFGAYVVAPVDYKGRHFVPEDAVLIDDMAVLRSIGSQLSQPILPRAYAMTGTVVPPDFNAVTDRYTTLSAPFDYTSSQAFLDGVQRVKHWYQDNIARWWDNDMDKITLKARLTSDATGHAQVVMSAKDKATGEALALKSSSWLGAAPVGNGEYLLKPNFKTAGGMVLRDALAKIPSLPDKAVLWNNETEADMNSCIIPPYPPRELLHLTPDAPWPFPKSAPAP